MLFVITKYLQSLKHSIDFISFFCIVTKNLQSTATMAINTKEEVEILGGKATIFTNDYGVWQFRSWLTTDNKYVRKSLCTGVKDYAIIVNHTTEDKQRR